LTYCSIRNKSLSDVWEELKEIFHSKKETISDKIPLRLGELKRRS
jgi:hypothetical protein